MRLVTGATSRFALAGLAVVLLAMGGLLLWATGEGNRSAAELGRSAAATKAQLQVTKALADVNTVRVGYKAEPNAAMLRRVRSAETSMARGLDELVRGGSLNGRELAYDVMPRLAAYRHKRVTWSQAVSRGDEDSAEQIEEGELEPLIAGLQEAIDSRLPDPTAGFRTELRRFAGSRSLVRRFTLVALPSAALLLLLCAAVLRAHRRRTEEQARADLARSQREATTDPLTGLWNRRRLSADLDSALGAGRGSPARLLVMFDLDGFKLYNDSFGHPAGDALLRRLAGKLAATLPPGALAYRVGGDEFCVLIEPGELEPDTVSRGLAAALSEGGEGFEVTASAGWVMLPAESTDPVAAMQIADRRMYASKSGGRASAGLQARDVLLAALREQQPDLREHLREVALLAHAVGRRLGLSPEQLDEVTRAGELHDIGKMAIPDAILRKPGPLTTGEWEFVRRHTVIGEGILSAAPAMLPVARIVRSAHERWDGGGYPDGIGGEEIPLGSRIVFACDAYDAMRSERIYRPGPLSRDQAVAELRQNAGTQFDPDIVAVLCTVLEEVEEERARDAAGTSRSAYA